MALRRGASGTLAPADQHAGGDEDRRQDLAQGRLRLLRPRRQPLRHAAGRRRGAGAHHRRERAEELGDGGVHRPGGDGPLHRLLVVARRDQDRADPRRPVAASTSSTGSTSAPRARRSSTSAIRASGRPNAVVDALRRRRGERRTSRRSTWAPTTDIYLARADWAQRRQDALRPAPDPRPEAARPAGRRPGDRREPGDPDRDEPALGRAQRTTSRR